MQSKAMISKLVISMSRDFAVVDVELDGGESARAVATFDKDDQMALVVNATDATMEAELSDTLTAALQVVMTHGV